MRATLELIHFAPLHIATTTQGDFFLIRHLLLSRPGEGLRQIQLQLLITQITAVIIIVINVIFSHCNESQQKNGSEIKKTNFRFLLV